VTEIIVTSTLEMPALVLSVPTQSTTKFFGNLYICKLYRNCKCTRRERIPSSGSFTTYVVQIKYLQMLHKLSDMAVSVKVEVFGI
jgi:hypothetical protein